MKKQLNISLKNVFKVCLILLFSNSLFAQTNIYNKFDKSNGLNSNTIYSIYEDSFGFLWVGTDLGLHKYNGANFEEILLPNDYSSLEIYKIWEHPNGGLWVSTNGCKIFTLTNLGLVEYAFNDSIEKIKGADLYFNDINYDSDHSLTFSLRTNGTFKIDSIGNISNQKITELSFNYSRNKWQLNNPSSNLIDYSDSVSFSVIDNNQVYKKTYVGMNRRIPNNQRIGGNQKNLRFSLSTTLFGFNNGDLHSIKMEKLISCVGVDKNGYTFVGSIFGGIVRLDKKLQNPIHILPEFKDKFVTALFIDSSENIWVGTNEFGLLQIQPWMLMSKKYVAEKNDQTAVALININDSIFIGYQNGLVSGNSLSQNNSEPKKIKLNAKVHLLNMNFIKDWNSFIGTKRTESAKLFKLSKTLEKSEVDLNLQGTTKTKIIDDDLFGFGFGLILKYRKDKNGNLFQEPIIKDKAYTFYDITLTNKSLIACTNHGLRQIENNNVVPMNFIGIPKNMVMSHIESIDGGFVCTNSEQGVYVSDGDKSINITDSHGLLSNNITCLYQDEQHLYVGTVKGLNICKKIQLHREDIKLHSLLMGKRINKIISNQTYIFVSTSDGIYQIPKSHMTMNSIIPKLSLNYIKNEESIIRNFDSTIEIPRNIAYSKVSFTASDINDYGSFNYEYKINDKNEFWIPIESNEILLSNLKPGSRTIQIRANRFNGPFSNVSEVHLNVPKLYYETLWFIGLSSFLILSGIFYFYLASQKRHELALQSINRELSLSQQVAQAKMNPHFVFNSLNSLKLLIKKGEGEKANTYLDQFSKLLRKIFEYGKSELTLLGSEIQYIEDYIALEARRFEGGLDYELIVDENINVSNILIPTMIIQPIIENAIWHGLSHSEIEKKLIMKITMNQTNLQIKISDNGVGMLKSKSFIPDFKTVNENEHSTAKIQKRMMLLSKLNQAKYEMEYQVMDGNDPTNPGTVCILTLPVINP